jgi:hypothetical protein
MALRFANGELDLARSDLTPQRTIVVGGSSTEFAASDQKLYHSFSMSAPIIVGAVAGATPLLFEASISIALLTAVPVGMWAKASISPLFELAREAGEAETVGAADRPLYPPAVLADCAAA